LDAIQGLIFFSCAGKKVPAEEIKKFKCISEKFQNILLSLENRCKNIEIYFIFAAIYSFNKNL